MIAARLRELLQELGLMLFLNTIELAELIKLSRQRVDNLEALEQFLATFLITAVLLALDLVVLVLQVIDLIVDRIHVSLLRAQLHDFLSQLV